MNDIILHHYPGSPFAEKARCLLGYKQLAWRSVEIPVIMPKPDLLALTGGYRGTPVLQIGADVYCDTALIAEVLERIAPVSSLFPEPVGGLSRILAQWADGPLFQAALAHAYPTAVARGLLGGKEQVAAYVADRAAVRGKHVAMGQAEADACLSEYLRRLEDMLADGSPYLLGECATYADFAVYPPLWHLRWVQPEPSLLRQAPKLQAWMDRIAQIGHHRQDPLAPAQALAIARASTAQPVSGTAFEGGLAQGARVRVAALGVDMGAVEGELLACGANRLSLRRDDARAGQVVVHFPRAGYILSPA